MNGKSVEKCVSVWNVIDDNKMVLFCLKFLHILATSV